MAPTVRVDDEVYEQLKANAEPFVDTPNTVLRRLLGLSPSGNHEEGNSTEHRDASPPPLTSVSRVTPARSGKAKSTRPGRKIADRKRVPPGTLLAEEHYEVPLLASLVELGGSAPSREVIDLVGKKLADRLTEVDKGTLNSGGIRWQSRVQFVRLRMIEQGLMLKETGRGVWAISDAGRDHVAKRSAGVA